MIVAVVLLAYAALLCALVPRLLRGRHWAERAPRFGIVLTVPTVRVSTEPHHQAHADRTGECGEDSRGT